MMKLLARSRPNAVCYKKKFNVLKMEVTIFLQTYMMVVWFISHSNDDWIGLKKKSNTRLDSQ